MSESVDRREGLRRGALVALALSLGIAEDSLARGAAEAARFQIKFYVGDRLLEAMQVGDAATRYISHRPTSVQMKWYDLETNRREPLSILGLTESRQVKVEGFEADAELDPRRG